jgi:poly[(R)-3-hydroxyalkanoate] polymerase subunit PhaC
MGERLCALAGGIDALGREQIGIALDSEIARRATAFIDGLEAYHRHTHQRPATAQPVIWQEAATRLLDYGGEAAGPAVLVVPSLINRYYVLDLAPEPSFCAISRAAVCTRWLSIGVSG